jgi:hypothetical protein
MDLDTCLTVFDQEYHVHSAILQLHSAFYFKFLDSPDKQLSTASSTGASMYQWVTEIDSDGSWALVALSNKSVSNNCSEVLDIP